MRAAGCIDSAKKDLKMDSRPLVHVKDLVKHFPLGGGLLQKPHSWIRAVDGVSFAVFRGESFGLVGESGCGKTTLGRLIVRLLVPTSGRVEFEGRDIFELSRSEMLQLRQRMQIIFQDPYSSLDPRMKVVDIVAEPLRAMRSLPRNQRCQHAAGILEKVGLRATDLNKYPHEFSGGQRQRICIARALCVRPELIVADEPVSALDVSIQAQVINLLENLREEFELSFIFISHDLSVIEHTCDRIAVMYLGNIVELAPKDKFIYSPRHPYTHALLQAVPYPDPHRKSGYVTVKGDVPNPINPPPGCPFHPRCEYVMDLCRTEKPALTEIVPHHLTACRLNSGHGLQG